MTLEFKLGSKQFLNIQRRHLGLIRVEGMNAVLQKDGDICGLISSTRHMDLRIYDLKAAALCGDNRPLVCFQMSAI